MDIKVELIVLVGHYDRSTGEYHYHHGYPEHQHLDGICPYDYSDNTSSSPTYTNSKNTNKSNTNTSSNRNSIQNTSRNTNTSKVSTSSNSGDHNISAVLLLLAFAFFLLLMFFYFFKRLYSTNITIEKEEKNNNDDENFDDDISTTKNNDIHITSKKQNLNTNEKQYICPKCGGILRIKTGKYGKFIGCANYPKCKYTKKLK